MTKANKKISQEELDFIEAEKLKNNQFNMPKMKQLAINLDKQDDEGNKIETDTWHVRGEKNYTDTITFRPLRFKQKFIRMVQNGSQWKIDNESIMVEGFEPAYDTKGGVGCGRIIGTLPDSWTEDQKIANYKKAGIYGFLFGMTTFPGEKPFLVNFRCPPAKVRAIREALSKKNIGETPYYKLNYTMKLAYLKKDGKLEKYASLVMAPDLNDVQEDFSEILPYIKESDAFIEAHNDMIMKRRGSILDNLKAQATYKDVAALSEDFADEEEESPKKTFGKDSIPF